MKRLLSKFALLIVSVTLVGCASNSQEENTTVGALTGAVIGGFGGSAIGSGTGTIVAIGAGAVIGALLGGVIGHSMDSNDTMYTYTTLNDNAPEEPHVWSNPHSGSRYKIVPMSQNITINGNPNCRKYRAIAIIEGKKKYTYGTACRQPNGNWEEVKT